MESSVLDSELKARHRAMWASGDYPSMVETFLLPLGPTLVEACGIGARALAPIPPRRAKGRSMDPRLEFVFQIEVRFASRIQVGMLPSGVRRGYTPTSGGTISGPCARQLRR